MKRIVLFLFLAMPLIASGQVVNFAKTLPERAFSLGLTPAYYLDNNSVGLRSIGVDSDQGGAIAIGLTGGYGIQYSLDLGVKFNYVIDGTIYFGVDVQYLAYETRNSYFSVIVGLHMWDGYGADLTGLFTYALNYNINLSVGLDMDVDYFSDYYETGESKVGTRFWLPLNVGFNINEVVFLYAEYDLQVSQWSWGIAAIGANFIFR